MSYVFIIYIDVKEEVMNSVISGQSPVQHINSSRSLDDKTSFNTGFKSATQKSNTNNPMNQIAILSILLKLIQLLISLLQTSNQGENRANQSDSGDESGSTVESQTPAPAPTPSDSPSGEDADSDGDGLLDGIVLARGATNKIQPDSETNSGISMAQGNDADNRPPDISPPSPPAGSMEPQSVDDTATTTQGKSILIDVLANDLNYLNILGDNLSIERLFGNDALNEDGAFDQLGNRVGQIAIESNAIRFTPIPSFVGQATFDYAFFDNVYDPLYGTPPTATFGHATVTVKPDIAGTIGNANEVGSDGAIPVASPNPNSDPGVGTVSDIGLNAEPR